MEVGPRPLDGVSRPTTKARRRGTPAASCRDAARRAHSGRARASQASGRISSGCRTRKRSWSAVRHGPAREAEVPGTPAMQPYEERYPGGRPAGRLSVRSLDAEASARRGHVLYIKLSARHATDRNRGLLFTNGRNSPAPIAPPNWACRLSGRKGARARMKMKCRRVSRFGAGEGLEVVHTVRASAGGSARLGDDRPRRGVRH